MPSLGVHRWLPPGNVVHLVLAVTLQFSAAKPRQSEMTATGLLQAQNVICLSLCLLDTY